MKTGTKLIIVAALAVAVLAAVVTKRTNRSGEANVRPTAAQTVQSAVAVTDTATTATASHTPSRTAKLPKLLDLGADKCIPCRMMAPILEELKREYAGRLEVEFIDVWKNPDAGRRYGIQMIPTQIFYDAEGRELFRHVGFISKEDILAKFRELGVDLTASKDSKDNTAIVRETPVAVDTRPPDRVCFMCDGDVNPQTRTLVKGQVEQRIFCSPHCYFIYFSSLIEADPAVEDAKVSVTDWVSGQLIPATTATYLYGLDKNGRPTIKAFADKADAVKEQQVNPGSILNWDMLRSKELATRCAFCDRAVYPVDACIVKFGDTRAYACCTHCAMGVAAKFKQDIEVETRDGFSGEPIRVKTVGGQIASIEPPTAIAWFGQKKNTDGQWVSAGCFKQGFFANQDNLKKWLDARPTMTGRQVTIAQVLADKMKLSPEQIAKACKLGECK